VQIRKTFVYGHVGKEILGKHMNKTISDC